MANSSVNFFKVSISNTHAWWGGATGGEGFIVYERTSHLPNIKKLNPYRFVDGSSSQIT